MSVLSLRFQPFSARLPVPVGAEVVIRRAELPKDASSITEMAENAHDVGAARIAAAGFLAELTSRPQRAVDAWLAFTGGLAVGLVASVTAGDPATARHSIAWLLVASHARRRGVGTALVATAVADACLRGAREIWAETRSDWPGAVAFWAAIGFEPVR